MKGTTIFLAGGEVEILTNALLQNGVRFILYSYYYILTMRRAEYIYEMQDKYPDVLWLLDSGAFTYSVQAQIKDLPSPEEYVKGYFKFIDRFGERWWRVTEPDLDGIDGMDVTTMDVRRWREEMLTRWPHLPIMPCFHGWRGMYEWEEYLRDPRIKCLALGRGCGDDHSWRRLTLMAQSKKKPVHGFGYTRINTALSHGVNVDSVDSTSWVMGQKYGSLYIMRGDKLITLNKEEKHRRKEFAGYFKALGCDPKLIEADDVSEVRKANIRTWRNIAERFHALKGRRDKALRMNEYVVLDSDGLPMTDLAGVSAAMERLDDMSGVEVDPDRRVAPMSRDGVDMSTVVRTSNPEATIAERPKARPILGTFGVPLERRAPPLYRPTITDDD